MRTTQDFIRWCIAERARLWDRLEDFEAAVVNTLALDERAAIGQIVAKIERVKARIANLDCTEKTPNRTSRLAHGSGMLEVLEPYPWIIGTLVGIAIGTIIDGSIGGTMTTLVIGSSAMGLYALAVVRGWF